MKYGQFCPIAKALEILGERWTLLNVRVMLMGGTRFNELQRGLSHISPNILTQRRNDLATAGIVIRKKIPGQRGHENFLTEMGRDDEALEVMERIRDLQGDMPWPKPRPGRPPENLRNDARETAPERRELMSAPPSDPSTSSAPS